MSIVELHPDERAAHLRELADKTESGEIANLFLVYERDVEGLREVKISEWGPWTIPHLQGTLINIVMGLGRELMGE